MEERRGLPSSSPLDGAEKKRTASPKVDLKHLAARLQQLGLEDFREKKEPVNDQISRPPPLSALDEAASSSSSSSSSSASTTKKVVVQPGADFLERYSPDIRVTKEACLPSTLNLMKRFDGLVALKNQRQQQQQQQQSALGKQRKQRALEIREGREQRPDHDLAVACNAIKACMLRQHLRDATWAMDLACHRGQDVAKWRASTKELRRNGAVVFVDLSVGCLQEAEERWKANQAEFPASFLQLDFLQDPEAQLADRRFSIYHCREGRQTGQRREVVKREERVMRAGQFDLISCQFAPVYASSSKEDFAKFLHFCSWLLNPRGGTLLLSMTDGSYLPHGEEEPIPYIYRPPPVELLREEEVYRGLPGTIEHCFLPATVAKMAAAENLLLDESLSFLELLGGYITNPHYQELLGRMFLKPEKLTEEDLSYLHQIRLYVFRTGWASSS